MQSLRVGISPVLEMSQHVGVCRYSPLHFITAAKAARVTFPPRIKITGLPCSRYFSMLVVCDGLTLTNVPPCSVCLAVWNMSC